MSEYILVGKTKKTHGIKGGLRLHVEEEFVEDVLKTSVAFLKIQGKMLPFFVEHFDYTNNLIVKFEDVDSPEAAISITSKDFYLREKDIHKKETIAFRADHLMFGKLIGFSIHDQTAGLIGEISEILEFPQQEMAQVVYKGKEILLPLNNELIVSVDEKAKVVLMALPEGILEL